MGSPLSSILGGVCPTEREDGNGIPVDKHTRPGMKKPSGRETADARAEPLARPVRAPGPPYGGSRGPRGEGGRWRPALGAGWSGAGGRADLCRYEVMSIGLLVGLRFCVLASMNACSSPNLPCRVHVRMCMCACYAYAMRVCVCAWVCMSVLSLCVRVCIVWEVDLRMRACVCVCVCVCVCP